MKICVLISDDVFFRPKALFRLLMKKGDDVCLVAEVRDGRENIKKEKHLAPLRLFGIRKILHLQLTVLATKALAQLLPPFSGAA